MHAADTTGPVYFCDAAEHIIGVRPASARVHELFAGTPGAPGIINASCRKARFNGPRSLSLHPEQHLLYVADTGASHDPDGPRHIRAFDVTDKGKLKKSRVFATCDAGLFDGFRLDTAGRLWSSAGDGVHCFAPNGDLLGKILVPEVVSNVCFGGVKKNRLYICGTTSLYAVLTHVNGAQVP